MNAAQEMIAFPLTTAVWQLLGLDDEWYVQQTYPSLVETGRGMYAASEGDARAILDSLNDHAGPDFDHTATERRALAGAARKLARAVEARS